MRTTKRVLLATTVMGLTLAAAEVTELRAAKRKALRVDVQAAEVLQGQRALTVKTVMTREIVSEKAEPQIPRLLLWIRHRIVRLETPGRPLWWLARPAARRHSPSEPE